MIGLRLVFSITLVLGGLLNPVPAEAQEAAKIARIGYLAPDRGVAPYQAFLQGLRDHGYVEGHNVVIRIPIRRGEPQSAPHSCGRTGQPQG